jgi:hypothetical protein
LNVTTIAFFKLEIVDIFLRRQDINCGNLLVKSSLLFSVGDVNFFKDTLAKGAYLIEPIMQIENSIYKH